MRRRFRLPGLGVAMAAALVPGAPAVADPATRAEEVIIDLPLARLAGTLLLPGGASADIRIPCAVIAGGSLSRDRDGGFLREGAPPRDALRRLAEVLASGGYASLRWDRPGAGESTTREGWKGTYDDEARALAAVIAHARARRDSSGTGFSRVVVIGESAGAYLACLAAEAGARADAYVFLGALCGPAPELYAYNFERLVRYLERFPENLAWAAGLRLELALGRRHREMFAAAAAGEETFELIDADFRRRVDLARRREELERPPDAAFRHIRGPVLALAGELDLNVPAAHAERIAEILRRAGNERVEAIVIPGADHSFQRAADSEQLRMRERFTLESFRRPYEPRAYRELIGWLREEVATPLGADMESLDAIAARAGAPPAPAAPSGGGAPAGPATGEPVVRPRGEHAPELVLLAPGVEIVEDITDPRRTTGVETLEGRIGPLILGEGSQAHYIAMPPGLYVEEHPHSSESIIYTVKGSWVLASGGQRRLMKEGSLFRFGAGKPTGYEVPFAEEAFILIFKGDRVTGDEKEFIEYLRGMAGRLEKERRDGVPYRLADLPEDHAAIRFAREVNPLFERGAGVAPGPAGAGALPRKVEGSPALENLLLAAEGIYSGGEPAGDAAFRAIAALGVKTVVSVDGARPDIEAARRHGLRYVHVPVGYSGVSETARRTLARVARDAEGPIYLHCHHGVHRGPAAAAVVACAAAKCDAPAALRILEAAGTSKSYPGLWRDVGAFEPPAAGAALPDLVEVARVDSFTAAMAAIDRSFDNLKLCAREEWRVPAGHPDIKPGHEALLLREGFQEASRRLEDRDARFRGWVEESLEAARGLEAALARDAPAKEDLDAAGERFRKLTQLCSSCHGEYR